MMARVLSLDSEEHQHTQELLPWFLNETLDADEAAGVAAHLEHCVRCQADAAAQAALRAIAVDAVDEGHSDSVDRDWAALHARLETQHEQARRSLGARPWWRQGLHLAVGIQAAVILVLAVVVVGVSLPSREPFRALGASASGAEVNALIVFRPDASEKDMREALRSAGAHIVGGPTASDAYLLHLSDPRAHTLAGLRAHSAVARAESLQGGPPR
ncbi:MAG TPA: zf-HC2 domain-containing protein [Caldimonas sp.]